MDVRLSAKDLRQDNSFGMKRKKKGVVDEAGSGVDEGPGAFETNDAFPLGRHHPGMREASCMSM